LTFNIDRDAIEKLIVGFGHADRDATAAGASRLLRFSLPFGDGQDRSRSGSAIIDRPNLEASRLNLGNSSS